ncbi:hypothetical protein [Enterovibrio calviensis]|uniref:hypothetical protein n=1 Tax=Enterovibrio calviensis TaxID=91359 RepID=UPI0037360F91
MVVQLLGSVHFSGVFASNQSIKALAIATTEDGAALWLPAVDFVKLVVVAFKSHLNGVKKQLKPFKAT